jgi:hypothetical protein
LRELLEPIHTEKKGVKQESRIEQKEKLICNGFLESLCQPLRVLCRGTGPQHSLKMV